MEIVAKAGRGGEREYAVFRARIIGKYPGLGFAAIDIEELGVGGHLRPE